MADSDNMEHLEVSEHNRKNRIARFWNKLFNKDKIESTIIPGMTDSKPEGFQDSIRSMMQGGMGQTQNVSPLTAVSYFYSNAVNHIEKFKLEKIMTYRTMEAYPEISDALDEVMDEAINYDDNDRILKLIIKNDKILQNDNKQENIQKEFKILFEEVIKSNETLHKWFREYLVVGQLILEKIINIKNPKKGIVRVKVLAPEITYVIWNDADEIQEYIQINEVAKEIIVLEDSQIAYIDTGIYEFMRNGDYAKEATGKAKAKVPKSYLHNAVRPYRQLRELEDSLIIYRLVRAPERRVFNIDVGKMPKNRAESFVKEQMMKYRQKNIYNRSTGELSQRSDAQAMAEDYWFPKTADGKGSSVDTLAGGCLTLDTKISLLDGRDLPLIDVISEVKDGKKLWTYSCDPETGEVVPGPIDKAEITIRDAEVMEMSFDNNETVKCTLNHKFPIWGKGLVEAKYIEIGDSVISFNVRKENLKGNVDIFNHRVTKIDILTTRMDVGNLTIDAEEKYHSYHTYALSIGIFTGNSNLGEIDDIVYFLKKLYKVLKIPISRLNIEQQSMFQGGNSGEISRDEIKFNKFVKRQVLHFSKILYNIFETHLKLKGLWDQYNLNNNDFNISFNKSILFEEYLALEHHQIRMEIFKDYMEFADKGEDEPGLFDQKLLIKNMLKWSDEDMDDNEKALKSNKNASDENQVMGDEEPPPPDEEPPSPPTDSNPKEDDN